VVNFAASSRIERRDSLDPTATEFFRLCTTHLFDLAEAVQCWAADPPLFFALAVSAHAFAVAVVCGHRWHYRHCRIIRRTVVQCLTSKALNLQETKMRSFFTIAAVLGVLGAGLAPARAQFHGPGTDSEMGDQQTSQLVAQGETCAKFKELKVGMTASQVLSACGQRPPRTSAMITTGGRKLVIWSYGNSQLHLIDDKLVQIFGP
jgi:hypothetical protein